MLSKHDICDFIEINRSLYGEAPTTAQIDLLLSMLRMSDGRHFDGFDSHKDKKPE